MASKQTSKDRNALNFFIAIPTATILFLIYLQQKGKLVP
jgi:hypothetical protein